MTRKTIAAVVIALLFGLLIGAALFRGASIADASQPQYLFLSTQTIDDTTRIYWFNGVRVDENYPMPELFEALGTEGLRYADDLGQLSGYPGRTFLFIRE